MNYTKKQLVDAIWQCYDTDKSGYLEKEEIDKFLSDVCASPKLRGMEKIIRQLIDANNDGVLDKQEMLDILGE